MLKNLLPALLLLCGCDRLMIPWTSITDGVPVPSWGSRDVVVRNTYRIHNSTTVFQPGETCLIVGGDTLTVVGKSKRVLLRYGVGGVASGDRCPSGALFFLDRGDFRVMQFAEWELREKRKDAKKEADLVSRVTRQPSR